ncbi:hypothetical protein BRARA_E00159 [Brassica rapa]|uniref:Uncharacterized protein n=1 Tax=Brassica campestris TaxID=3711 RepID=A0A397Z5Q7_BRACM|nr:hypothetical protein BRARA_E00159 [Brassica rapa]
MPVLSEVQIHVIIVTRQHRSPPKCTNQISFYHYHPLKKCHIKGYLDKKENKNVGKMIVELFNRESESQLPICP